MAWSVSRASPRCLAVQNNVGVQELLAMDMKSRGMYVCRTLGFRNAEFTQVRVPVEGKARRVYAESAALWIDLLRAFSKWADTCKAYTPGDDPSTAGGDDNGDALADGADTGAATSGRSKARKGSAGLRLFWGAHQRFFRALCMSAKVPRLVEESKRALKDGHAVVIGLQSTGEARTNDVVSKRGEELDDFVSGAPPRALPLALSRFAGCSRQSASLPPSGLCFCSSSSFYLCTSDPDVPSSPARVLPLSRSCVLSLLPDPSLPYIPLRALSLPDSSPTPLSVSQVPRSCSSASWRSTSPCRRARRRKATRTRTERSFPRSRARWAAAGRGEGTTPNRTRNPAAGASSRRSQRRRARRSLRGALTWVSGRGRWGPGGVGFVNRD